MTWKISSINSPSIFYVQSTLSSISIFSASSSQASMALSDNSGYCENCAVHKSALLRLYDGVTFMMICQACYSAQGHSIKAGDGHEHRRVYHMYAADPQHIYKCPYANLGCHEGNNDAAWKVYDHSKICKWAAKVTCTTCWQSVPVVDYEAHKNGSRRDLWI